MDNFFLTLKQEYIHLAEELLEVCLEVLSIYQHLAIIHVKVVMMPFERQSVGWTCKKAVDHHNQPHRACSLWELLLAKKYYPEVLVLDGFWVEQEKESIFPA